MLKEEDEKKKKKSQHIESSIKQRLRNTTIA
jgi:hypothetical protein